MSRIGTWRLALRIARRDAVRHRGRSILVLVMIALPVLAVTTADVVIQTQDVTVVEGLDGRLGAADASVEVNSGGAPMIQDFEGDSYTTVGDASPDEPPTVAALEDALGGARLVEARTGEVIVRSDDGASSVEATEVDLHDPVTKGLFELESGRWPDAGEVVVNQALLDEGYAVGDRLELRGSDAADPTIVGVAAATRTRTYPVAAGPVGSLGIRQPEGGGPTQWLADGGAVDWEEVKRANALGAIVVSRAVVTDPPPESEIPAEIQSWGSGADDAMIAVVVLIVVMALLEVVLLAGPAFAVTARRQSRTLALMAASGGTPTQSRRVVVGNAVVLGGAAAGGGVVLGVGLAGLLVPVLQNYTDNSWGPFEVPWLHLVGIALFGLVSALLAALVPAWIASGQDVVAVLAGRRADKPLSLRSPILGLVLVGVGVAGAAYGAWKRAGGELAIAASAVVAVLGMILLVPVVVVAVARLARRLPLSPRYAARDAARHRTRTVPAVAAVAATVTGVVALSISITSDEAQNRETYTPSLPMGHGAVVAEGLTPAEWDSLTATVQQRIPDATVTQVVGVVESSPMDDPEARAYYVEFGLPGAEDGVGLLNEWASMYGSSVFVADRLPPVIDGISDADRVRADQALAAGRPVAFTEVPVDATEIELTTSWWNGVSGGGDELARVTVPAAFVPYRDEQRVAVGVLPPSLLERLEVPARTVGLAVSGTEISADQDEAVEEAAQAQSQFSGFYVERGYVAPSETVIIQLVLVGLGAVLMLGGTLTATFLALSDARPDLATLSAVGASPRRRRSVAAAYALVIGLVGSVLGAAIGFIPGIAVTYPLTYMPGNYAVCSGSGGCAPDGVSSGPFLDIPWLMILTVVIGLPLLSAAIVALCTRSRLPMVARLD